MARCIVRRCTSIGSAEREMCVKHWNIVPTDLRKTIEIKYKWKMKSKQTDAHFEWRWKVIEAKHHVEDALGIKGE